MTLATTLDMAPGGDGTCSFEIVITGMDVPEKEARKVIIDLMACAGERISLNQNGWTDAEKQLLQGCSDRAEAWLKYQKEYPKSLRTSAAVPLTPDLIHSLKEHNLEMKDWWGRKEYVRARSAFVKRNPFCIRCGRPTQTPGHSYDDYQHGYEHYLQRVIDDDCDPLCNRCNLNEKYGRKPCPVCVDIARAHGYDISIRIRYISQYEEVCFNHLPEAEQSRIWSRKRKHLDKHPCIWHGKGQRCKSVIHWSNTCDRSALTAEGCDQFMGKLVKA